MTMPPGSFIGRGGAPDPLRLRLSRLATALVVVLAIIGGVLGVGMLWLHLTTDPLIDVRAYYDAAVRLNAGQPLYLAGGDPTRPTYYFYPPLMAILMRPFAVLPFHVFALGWACVVLASFVSLVRTLGAGRRTFLALGLLGMPLGWALAVGQAHIPMTLLVAIGQPWSIALAANVKLFPILIAVWWLGRRNFQAVSALIAWTLVLVVFQLLLEPTGSLAFFSAVGLDQVAGVQNLSPYAISPILWVVLVAAGGLAALVLAPTRWGWAAAVTLATLASPRLLVYMLSELLAAVREPRTSTGDRPVDAGRHSRNEGQASSTR